ncbi:MAG TPA: ABC transporter ATP-binding protein [Acidiphilium sp.]
MTDILTVSGLTKLFGGFRAVDDVGFSVRAGSIHAVIGPNGAGKTTLFRLLTGVHRPSSGEVRFKGEVISGRKPHAIARRGLALAFQITTIFPRLSVLESLAAAIIVRKRRSFDFVTFLHTSRQTREEAMELLDRLGIADLAGAEARTLSHGDQRALEVALALATGPQLLMLDEPTAGMSPYETERTVTMVQRLARDHALTVLFSEHDTDVVFGISDRITVMHRGRVIAEGPPAEIRDNPEVGAVYLGTEV